MFAIIDLVGRDTIDELKLLASITSVLIDNLNIFVAVYVMAVITKRVYIRLNST